MRHRGVGPVHLDGDLEFTAGVKRPIRRAAALRPQDETPLGMAGLWCLVEELFALVGIIKQLLAIEIERRGRYDARAAQAGAAKCEDHFPGSRSTRPAQLVA